MIVKPLERERRKVKESQSVAIVPGLKSAIVMKHNLCHRNASINCSSWIAAFQEYDYMTAFY